MRKRNATTQQRFLTIPQVTEVFGWPERTVYDLITKGHLAFVRFPESRRIWIERGDLEKFAMSAKERRGRSVHAPACA